MKEGRRDWGEILDCVTPKVSMEMNEALATPVSEDEVKKAAMQMGGLKAPGSDGFSGIFYQSNWETLARDANMVIKELMSGLVDPRKINATHLVNSEGSKSRFGFSFPSN